MRDKWEPWEYELGDLAEKGDVDAVSSALASGRNARSRALATALCRSANHGHLPVVELLLASGARPNLLRQGDPTMTALVAAVHARAIGVIEALLRAGADPNQPDPHGHTALAIATSSGDLDVIEALLRGGAAANLEASKGERPTRIAQIRQSEATAGLLAAKTEDEKLALAEKYAAVGALLKKGDQIGATTAAKRAKAALAALGRPAYALKLAKGEAADPSATQIGGEPLLPPGAPWPVCRVCAAPMMHLARVRLGDFEALGASGVVQLFECRHLHANARAPAELVAEHHEDGARLERRAPSPPARPIPPQHVKQVPKPKVDLPSPLLVSDPRLFDWKTLHAESRAAAHLFAIGGDKVGGWPAASEELVVPRCPDCDELLSLRLQLVAKGATGFVFGSRGRAFVLECRTHAGRIACVVQHDDW